jgi:hypothetical protein
MAIAGQQADDDYNDHDFHKGEAPGWIFTASFHG